jgi:type IV pilus assembly protein PilY1
MKHRHASGLVLGAVIIAGTSLSDAPDALSQIVEPACEQTATPPALSGAALNAATPIKPNVVFNGTALVLNGAATCGTVFAREVDLAVVALDTTEMNITAVRLVADFTGDVRFSATSADADEYVRAYDCDATDPGTDLCVRFPKASGRSLRWKAEMCNTAGAPAIRSVQTIFDYNADNEHYHGGIAVHENIAYFGGFGQPGDLGQLYAISTDFGTDHWNGRDRLQADIARAHIYTTTFDGTQRLLFDQSNAANPLMIDVLGVPSNTEAGQVIGWVRTDERFGTNPIDGAKRRFGGVITSTPTVVAKPDLPVWFSRAEAERRLAFQTFQTNNADRPPMVLYGAKDGMVHALFSDPASIIDTDMGTEAWAYIPASVASRLYSDYQESQSRGRTFIRAYPDTWPVVEDVRLQSTGLYATLAVLNEGKGGSSISVLDITDTATGDAASGYSVTGPRPLWYRTPGDFDAGQSLNRPAIARVNIDGDERHMVIAGTGIAFDDPDSQKGRVVVAYDAETGNPYWQFQTRCSLTTAISVFETDDEGEPAPSESHQPELKLDGFMDRAVFADRCGYVYKIDLTRVIDGGWNPGLGGILVDVVAGTQLKALFQTAGGLPVTGNIGVRALLDDDTTRASLFFGTGGLDDAPPFPQNSFYVIAAAPENVADDNPANLVFQTIDAICNAPSQCEKFYGGVRLNPEQVIFTRVLEPVIGDATCDPGQTTIEARDITGDVAGPNFLEESFTTTTNSMITSPLTARGNAIYFTDSRGRVNSVGDPQTPNTGFGPDEGSGSDTNAPMLLLGWRQVY